MLDKFEYDVDLTNLEHIQRNKIIIPYEGILGSFDWLSVTFNCFEYESDSDFIKPVLNNQSKIKIRNILSFFNREAEDIDDFEQETGVRGFKYKITLQEGAYLLFYGPETVNGIRATALNLSGAACHWLIAKNKFIDVLRYCLEYGYNFTRFDACIDNFTSLLNMEYIYYIFSNKYYSTNYKKIEVLGTPNPESSYKYDGITIYCGRGSDMFLRIYAKNWEQEVQEEIKDWVRWEIQIRDHERIKQLIIMIILCYGKGSYDNYFSIVAALLKELIMFKIPGTSKRRSDWIDDPEYLEFLNGVEGIKLFKSPKSSSEFIITKNWFEKSCSLFLTQLSMIYGEEKLIKYLKYLIISRFSELKANNWNLVINEYDRICKPLDKRKIVQMISKFESEIDISEFSNSLKLTDEAKEYIKQKEKEESDSSG